MQTLYYSVIGVLAIIVHLIINNEMFSKPKRKDNFTEKYFHLYLLSVLFYYVTDVLWGTIDYLENTKFLYIDTVFYYITMTFSVVFCCRYIASFLNLRNLFNNALKIFSFIFCASEFIALVINIFVPIFFYFDSNGNYQTGIFRHIALITQIVMYAVVTLISFFIVLKKSDNNSKRNVTICLFALTMTAAITAQAFFPLLPLYTIGLMIGTCVLHVFIQEDIKKEQFDALESLASVFYSMHIIDLDNDTVEEYSALDEVKEIVNHKHGAVEMMNQIITATTEPDYLEKALEFTDLTTVAERMKNKNLITGEFVGTRVGWFDASFVTMEKDSEEKPTKVIFTTRVIDEEKKQEEKLIKKTQTDEMTGLLNRRAYEEDIYEHNDIPDEKDFIYVSIDVNGLKVVNDTNGHTAGDELIVGACQCMKKTLGVHGKLYRIGGDEFVAILFKNLNDVSQVLSDFDNAIFSWKGKLIDSLSVSYGWVSKDEIPDASVRQLGAIAEKRMYEAKSEHYRKQGVDRRGQMDAHKALCELYTKILKINITDDTYTIVNMNESEQTADKGFANKISDWLINFGKSGLVHSDDLDEYLRLTDFDYMKNYFKSQKSSLHIFYRRKYDNIFKQVMMEIIPAKDYSDDNQSLYLYVKEIDK